MESKTQNIDIRGVIGDERKYYLRLLPKVEDTLLLDYEFSEGDPVYVNYMPQYDEIVITTRAEIGGYKSLFTIDEVKSMVDSGKIVPEMFIVVAESDVEDLEKTIDEERCGKIDLECECECKCERCQCDDTFCDCYDDAYATDDLTNDEGNSEDEKEVGEI